MYDFNNVYIAQLTVMLCSLSEFVLDCVSLLQPTLAGRTSFLYIYQLDRRWPDVTEIRLLFFVSLQLRNLLKWNGEQCNAITMNT